MADSSEISGKAVNTTPHVDPAATDETTVNARDGAKKRRDRNEPAAVVGLGASAGGIGPLQQFFGDMQPDTGLAFVVVMHLSPDFESHLADVLQQRTSMPVMQVTAPVKVKPNHVYVIPPNHQLTFNDSMLEVVPPQRALGRRVTIDLFFRTLAMAYGQRAVCVILSGTDSDGVIGLKHIRAQGGLTIAQDPNEAEHDSMPVTAISTGMVDWVLPIAQLAPKLREFVHNENRMKLPPETPDAGEPDAKVEDAPGGETVSEETHDAEHEEAIERVLSDLRAQTGHDFTHYKRATILRRIARRMQVNSLESIPRYVDFIRTHSLETRALLQDLLIGVTHFFRDRDAFAALEAHIPQLFAGKTKDDEVRVWVPGCATGEEAHSIAMLLCEHCKRLENPPTVQIFATDIDEQSIADARDGLYPSMIEADVSPERLREFFVKDHGRYRVRKEIREKVVFAAHNLLKDPPFSRCDLISCRNLLIYLNGQAQQQVFDIFHFALRAGGLLFLGSAENHSQGQSLFSPVDAQSRVFVRRSTPRPVWKVPMVPLRTGAELIRQPTGRRSRALPPLTHSTATDLSAAAPQAGHARREVLFGELHLRLLEEYGPPSVVVNDAHEIVHLSGTAGRYLRFVAGEPTANITKVIDPALQIELRTALFKAAQSKESVTATPKHVDFDGTGELIRMVVRPMKTSDQASGFFLVLFEKQGEAAPDTGTTALDGAGEVTSREASEEIDFLKEELNATVEQYEAANEQLKASNEELQAMNEEMRSTTEELETSKEELQSVNEELITVNYELKSNVDELSRTNADLNNLMASSDIGTIFLDGQLRIHRFTPAAQRVFNLIPSDMGRPISDITSALNYEGFVADAERVLRHLHTIEREVQLADATWFMTRIAPYRTSEDRIAGVVATFIDITRRKRAEEEVRTGATRYRTLFELVPVAVYTTDAEGRIQEHNQRAAELWGRRPGAEKFCGSFKIYHPDGRPMPHDQCPMARVLRGEELQAADLEILVEQENGTRRSVIVAPRALVDDEGVIVGAINCLHDISARKGIEKALRASEERFRTVADNVPQVIWTNEPRGKANYFNKRWYEYTGLSYEQSFGLGWQAAVHPEDLPGSVERWEKALKKGEVFDTKYRLRSGTGDYRWFIGRNVPLRDSEVRIIGWFGSATDIDELKQTEEALRESEERFRLLVEGARDYAMFLLDLDNTITFWSNGAERIFGWSEEEAIGQTGDIIFTPEDKKRDAVDKEISIALREGRAPDRRWHLRKDNSRMWVDGVMMRLDDGNGQPRGFAKIARDATDQRHAEDELRHARDQLEQRVLERTADLMATNNELERTMAQREQLERELLEISERERRRVGQDLHDIVCQELTATALFLKSSGNKIQNAEAARSLSEAAQIVNRNVAIARDLARGFQPSVLGSGGLTEALRDLCKQANQQRNLHCVLKLPKSIRVRDEVIALNLYRIAQEAMRNAISHAQASEILICIERERDLIRMIVEDDGKGFRQRKRSKGLGIHIMRYRANVLGGTLMIDPRPRGGTKVTCEVPVKATGQKKTTIQRK